MRGRLSRAARGSAGVRTRHVRVGIELRAGAAVLAVAPHAVRGLQTPPTVYDSGCYPNIISRTSERPLPGADRPPARPGFDADPRAPMNSRVRLFPERRGRRSRYASEHSRLPALRGVDAHSASEDPTRITLGSAKRRQAERLWRKFRAVSMDFRYSGHTCLDVRFDPLRSACVSSMRSRGNRPCCVNGRRNACVFVRPG